VYSYKTHKKYYDLSFHIEDMYYTLQCPTLCRHMFFVCFYLIWTVTHGGVLWRKWDYYYTLYCLTDKSVDREFMNVDQLKLYHVDITAICDVLSIYKFKLN